MKIRKAFWPVLAVFIILVILTRVGLLNQQGVDLFIRVIALLSLTVGFSWLWAWLSIRQLEVARQARETRHQVGEVFEERFTVRNRLDITRLWVEVEDHSTLPGAGGSRVLSMLTRHEDRSYWAYTLLTRRGEFTLGPTVLRSGDLFGLFCKEKTVENPRNLLVFPYLVDLNTFPMPAGVLTGGRVLRRRATETTPHAAGVREYAPGDSLARIHWLTTARRDRLMVKEFDQDPQADVYVFLDGCSEEQVINSDVVAASPRVEQIFWRKHLRTELPDSTFEYGVSVAASVGKYFIKKGQAVGFASAGQIFTVLSAERGERQMGKLLETLALLRPEGNLPINGLVEAEAPHLPRGSTVVMVTSSVHDDVLLAVDGLLFRDMRPVVVLVDAASFGGESGAVDLLVGLRSRQIPVAMMRRGDLLQEVLENGFYH